MIEVPILFLMPLFTGVRGETVWKGGYGVGGGGGGFGCGIGEIRTGYGGGGSF